MSAEERATVLVVEDDAGLARLLTRRLEHAGYSVIHAATAAEGLDRIAQGGLDLILLDQRLPGGASGLELYRQVKAAGRDIPTILVTAFSGEQIVLEALRAGVRDFVPKTPDYLETLLPVVARVLNEARAVRQLAEAQARLIREQAARAEVERSAEALRASEERFRRLFEAAQDAILILDADTGKILDANPAVKGLLGYAHDELAGMEWWQIGFLADQQSSGLAFRRLQEEGSIRLEELPLQTKRGVRREVEFVGNVYRVNDHKVIQCNLRDISARKQAEEALREADRRKDEFLAMLAHELRNPLAPIRNALHLMEMAGANEAFARQARQMIERQVEQLVRLVDDLLDVSRITRGKINLQKQRVDLATLVARAVESSQPLIDARKHRLEIAMPKAPLVVEGDPVRLVQVLLNLLNNAAKYTPEGGQIWLTAELASRDGQQPEAVLRVRDTGMGIPRNMLPKVFDLFTQVDRSRDRAEGGLGIGLTLVHRLVELHGGTVEACSEGPGQGSEFIVRLPLLAATPPPDREKPLPRATPAAPKTAHRILVVDDNRDSAESLATLLRLLGNDVRTAHDGRLALEIAAAYRPDVVVLDIGLPGMSGLEVGRLLRERQKGTEQPLIVAMTGYGQEEDRRRSQEAGFNAHLVKPVDLKVLQELLASTEFARPASEES
jgi:PAS domain S-box-containing protein